MTAYQRIALLPQNEQFSLLSCVSATEEKIKDGPKNSPCIAPWHSLEASQLPAAALLSGASFTLITVTVSVWWSGQQFCNTCMAWNNEFLRHCNKGSLISDGLRLVYPCIASVHACTSCMHGQHAGIAWKVNIRISRTCTGLAWYASKDQISSFTFETVLCISAFSAFITVIRRLHVAPLSKTVYTTGCSPHLE